MIDTLKRKKTLIKELQETRAERDLLRTRIAEKDKEIARKVETNALTADLQALLKNITGKDVSGLAVASLAGFFLGRLLK